MCSDLHDENISWAARQHLAQTARQDRVAVISLADHQCTNQDQQGLTRQGTPHATDLTQCCKARTDSCNSVRSPSIWTPRSRTDVTGGITVLPMRTGDWDLMLTALGQAPQDFCFAGMLG